MSETVAFTAPLAHTPWRDRPSCGRTLFTNLQLLDASDNLVPGQILVDENQKIAAVIYGASRLETSASEATNSGSTGQAASAKGSNSRDFQVIDMRGALATAGLVDLHIHLREPGQEDKETINTGTAAAARGGWTTVCAMPNTIPDPHTPELLQQLRARFDEAAVIKTLPFSPITRALTSADLVDFTAQAQSGAVAFSNDGKGVQSGAVMLAAMQAAAATGLPVATHAEDESLMNKGVINAGVAAEKFNLPGIHRLAESVQVARDVLIAEATGAHHHLCHASTAESIRIIRRAQSDGVNVSAEASPHHLLLADSDIPSDNANWKMNPPLRENSDIAAMIAGLNDGTIQAIATDNAPHLAGEKNCSFKQGAFGIVTNEFSFALLYTRLVLTGALKLGTLVRALTSGPARLFHLEDHESGTAGHLKPGAQADLAFFDLDTPFTIDPAGIIGKGHNTPFGGSTVKGNCIGTLCAGRWVYRSQWI